MKAEKWERMFQILSVLELINNERKNTTVRDLTEYLKTKDKKIDVNIINSSIRHYRKIGLIKRKHDPYKRPFQYVLSNKGEEQIDWLENEDLDFLTN